MEIMKAQRYLIKATYLEGPHEGETYFLRKDGHVTEADFPQGFSDTYASKASAARRCRKLESDNTIDRNIERREETHRIKKGKPPKEWYLYHLESYEPFEVEAIDFN